MSARRILPATVIPAHYNLIIVPNFDSFVFSGEVSISLQVVTDTKVITTNAKDLEFVSASVVGFRGLTEWPEESALKLPKQNAIEIIVNQEQDTVSFVFEHTLPAKSSIVLHICYKGIHNDQMNGFYRSTYLDGNGEKKIMLATQFEPADCRKCLPCWDEPCLKSTFTVSLYIPFGMQGLSNMPVEESNPAEIDGTEYTFLRFAVTPKMSTYLLAFVIGDFEYLEQIAKPVNSDPIVCRVYTLPGQKELGRFALEIAVKVLEFFAQYFDMPYPLPKLDQIAVPDFSAGAMENFGLVTYRDSYLLFDAETYSAKAKEDVADTVAHELAHQWFGNLVTMEWWSELWLNEGFATFVGTLAVNHLYPEWDHFTGFLQTYFSQGLDHDSLVTSHPIHVEVSTPSEVEQIFDAISYNKGASVIRMLENWIGRDKFSKGVNSYLKEFIWSNATTEDLWRCLSVSSKLPVDEMMQSWVSKTGYPVLSIIGEKYDAEKKEMELLLKQERFLASTTSVDEDETIWFIPISVMTNDGNITTHYLKTSQGSISFSYTEKENSCYKLNVESSGFFRVNYNSGQITRITKNKDLFSVKDRIELVSDVFAMAKSGRSGTVVALDLLKGLKDEENGIVLACISREIRQLYKTFSLASDEITQGLDQLTRFIFYPKVQQMGLDFEKEDHYSIQKKRATMVTISAKANIQEVVDELNTRYDRYRSGDFVALDSNLYAAAFATLLVSSKKPKEDFENILEIYRTTANISEREAALLALGSVNSFSLAHTMLFEHALCPETVRTQDMSHLVVGLESSPLKQQALDLKFDWLDKNLSEIARLLDSRKMPVSQVFSGFIGEEYASKLETWAQLHCKVLKSSTRDVAIAIENIRALTAWKERDEQKCRKVKPSPMIDSRPHELEECLLASSKNQIFLSDSKMILSISPSANSYLTMTNSSTDECPKISISNRDNDDNANPAKIPIIIAEKMNLSNYFPDYILKEGIIQPTEFYNPKNPDESKWVYSCCHTAYSNSSGVSASSSSTSAKNTNIARKPSVAAVPSVIPHNPAINRNMLSNPNPSASNIITVFYFSDVSPLKAEYTKLSRTPILLQSVKKKVSLETPEYILENEDGLNYGQVMTFRISKTGVIVQQFPFIESFLGCDTNEIHMTPLMQHIHPLDHLILTQCLSECFSSANGCCHFVVRWKSLIDEKKGIDKIEWLQAKAIKSDTDEFSKNSIILSLSQINLPKKEALLTESVLESANQAWSFISNTANSYSGFFGPTKPPTGSSRVEKQISTTTPNEKMYFV